MVILKDIYILLRLSYNTCCIYIINVIYSILNITNYKVESVSVLNSTSVLSPIYKKTSIAYNNEVLFNKTAFYSSTSNNNLNKLNLPTAIQLNTINPEDKILEYSELSELVLPPIKNYKSKLLKGKGNPNHWILIDNKYNEQMQKRSVILKVHKKDVIGHKKITREACKELFHYVMVYISNKYPHVFKIVIKDNSYKIHNIITNKQFKINNINKARTNNLLAIISQCVLEDFSIIVKINGNYNIMASLSLFSINWKVSERLGYDMIKLHGIAPGWQVNEIYSRAYTKVFDDITSNILKVRSNLFVINTHELYLPNHEVKSPLSMDIGVKLGYRLKDLYLRRELQTFFRLPKSGHIVFSVRTFIEPLSTLSINDLKYLESSALKYNYEVSIYHKADSWLPVLTKYLEDNKT